jgi:hypothetical protein
MSSTPHHIIHGIGLSILKFYLFCQLLCKAKKNPCQSRQGSKNKPSPKRFAQSRKERKEVQKFKIYFTAEAQSSRRKP